MYKKVMVQRIEDVKKNKSILYKKGEVSKYKKKKRKLMKKSRRVQTFEESKEEYRK